MIKVVQFGEGNFLRTFVDLYFDTLNKEFENQFEVNVVKSVPFGSLSNFIKQNNKYHVVLRGYENGKTLENIYHVDCIKKAIDLFANDKGFYSLAEDPETLILVSNTTEAGICFDGNDRIENYPNITYPAKLTLWLYHRYKKGLNGIYLLPVELIDNNADELFKCVEKYIDLFNLGDDFKKWNQINNFYCNTLVDRIVSGFPKDDETKDHLFNLIGEDDQLMSVGEPFGLWVIQDKGSIKNILKNGFHNINVIFTPDISYYKKRKVRVLNGSHTNLVPISLWMGKETVFDVMNDEKLLKFVNDTLMNDIVPFVSDDIEQTKVFADSVKERFLNPFLNHQLLSISLNSISKWKARNLPSFIDFYNKNHQIPKYLTIGFSYLINLYQRIKKTDNGYICSLPTKEAPFKDDAIYLDYFQNHSVGDFLRDKTIWGIDLTSFDNLEEQINEYLLLINSGKDLI